MRRSLIYSFDTILLYLQIYFLNAIFAANLIGAVMGIYIVSRTHERLERVQYLIFNIVALVAFILFSSQLLEGLDVIQSAYVRLAIATIIFAVFSYVAARRLNHIGWTVWLAILTCIPVLNFLFALVLLLVPGQRKADRVNQTSL